MTGGRLQTSVVEDPKGPDVAEGGDDINADAAVRFLRVADSRSAVLPLVLVAAGIAIFGAGVAVLRSFGSGVRIGRLLAAAALFGIVR